VAAAMLTQIVQGYLVSGVKMSFQMTPFKVLRIA
jgi:hypothetical protein